MSGVAAFGRLAQAVTTQRRVAQHHMLGLAVALQPYPANEKDHARHAEALRAWLNAARIQLVDRSDDRHSRAINIDRLFDLLSQPQAADAPPFSITVNRKDARGQVRVLLHNILNEQDAEILLPPFKQPPVASRNEQRQQRRCRRADISTEELPYRRQSIEYVGGDSDGSSGDDDGHLHVRSGSGWTHVEVGSSQTATEATGDDDGGRE